MIGRLGPFVLEESLSANRGGRVFRAVHPEQKKLVAIKRIPMPLLLGNMGARQQLMGDFETQKSFDHPNLAKSFGGFLQAQETCYAYELVRGESVADVLERRDRLTWEQTWDLIEPAVSLLSYLHARDFYLGAFYPDRAMFDPLGSLRIVSLNGLWDRERDRRRPGDPERRFLAPEVRSEDPPNVKSDLWSLGALAYACVTGAAPEEDAARAVEPPSMMIAAPDCPFWFDRIVLHLLAPDPAARPFNAGAVALALAEGRKRMGERVGVAEHVAKGFSPLQIDQRQREEALDRLDRQRHAEDEDAPGRDFERAIPLVAVFGLSLVFIALSAVIVWMLIPKPDAERLNDTAAWLETGHRDKIRDAHDVLTPMLVRHPDDDLTPEIREQLDEADMYLAEEALRIRMEFNRPYKTEAERLYAKGKEMENLGDRVGALEQFRSITAAIDPESDDRPIWKLAERDALRLQREGADGEQVEFVQSRLDEAAERLEAGRIADARKLWQSIVSLYRDDEHLAPLVKEAESNLRQTADLPDIVPADGTPPEA